MNGWEVRPKKASSALPKWLLAETSCQEGKPGRMGKSELLIENSIGALLLLVREYQWYIGVPLSFPKFTLHFLCLSFPST